MYLLDTNIVNRLRYSDTTVMRRLAPVADFVFVSTLTAEEILVQGYSAEINKIRSGKSRADLERTNADFSDAIVSLSVFWLLPYTREAEAMHRTFRTAKLKGMDGRIAAHALALGFILVTDNIADFALPGLTVVDWTR